MSEGGAVSVPPPARPARTYTLRAYLVAITLAVMLPMGVLGAIAIREAVRQYQHAYQERLLATSRLLSLSLDSDIEMRKTAIMALADSPLLDNPTGPDLYNYARQIGDGLDAWVSIKTPDQQLMNTRFPYGSQLPKRQQPWDPAAVEYYRVTNVVTLPGVSTPFASVIGPVRRDGHVVATISIPFRGEQLGRRLAEGLFTTDGVLCVLDGNGIVIARSRAHEKFVGRRVPDWIIAAAAAREPTIALGRLLDGGDVIARPPIRPRRRAGRWSSRSRSPATTTSGPARCWCWAAAG
jgi:hypothetical protein